MSEFSIQWTRNNMEQRNPKWYQYKLKKRYCDFGKNSIIRMSNMPVLLKIEVFNQCVLHATSYETKTWSIITRTVQRLQTTQRIRSQTKLFGITDRIKQLNNKWPLHNTKEKYQNTNNMQTIEKNVKLTRRLIQVRWKDEIRKIVAIKRMIKAPDRKQRKNVYKICTIPWILKLYIYIYPKYPSLTLF